MITYQKTFYVCEKCRGVYDTESEAVMCEEQLVTHDKGVTVGDTVRVTQGDGKSELAKVTKVAIVSKDWGHSNWKRYWYTVRLEANLIESYGSRTLTFDDYEPLNNTETKKNESRNQISYQDRVGILVFYLDFCRPIDFYHGPEHLIRSNGIHLSYSVHILNLDCQCYTHGTCQTSS